MVYNKGYEFIELSSSKKSEEDCRICTRIFRFKTVKNATYTVLVEVFKNDVYGLKFYYQGHANSKRKYSLETKQHDARRIIKTCVDVGYTILTQNPEASFVFIGSPSKAEAKRESDPLKNTKRFKVYSGFAAYYFSNNSFEHRLLENKSCYLIINRKKLEKNRDFSRIVFDMFNTHFNIDHLIAEMVNIG